MRSLLTYAIVALVLIANTTASLARSSSSRSSGTGRYSCSNCNTHEHWVQPHNGRSGWWQTNPNGTKRDNFSCEYNINPHTGKPGTKSC